MELRKFISKQAMVIAMGSVLVFLVGMVIFARLPYVSFTGERIVWTPLEIDMNNLNFAGEKVDIDPLNNPLGHEKLEKELLVTHFSLYQFLLFTKYSQTFFPYIESYFQDSGLPDDLKYLAVAESGLRTDAESRVGARGMWQLMPETARRYGLRVDDEIDERLHFERSTRAAAAYLLYLKNIFGNWTLASAAYNRGENGLQRDQKAQPAAKNYYDLVLNDETGNYIYRIVAIKYLMQNRWKLFSPELLGTVFQGPATKKVTLTGPILDLREYSLKNDIDYQELRELNPWILGYTLPSGPWEVKLFVR
ncbi:lytic transglycosylase domain-containing protein [Candidatus Gracilibacteria bacterium]|nr:lytic transglycosylase domain-containing protein [Candidatus Gracilibacteria bacterium]